MTEWMCQRSGSVADGLAVSLCRLEGATGRYIPVVKSQKSQFASDIDCVSCYFAGGRFGPLDLPRFGCARYEFRRLEVGVRIQQPARAAFFARMRELDQKLKMREAGLGIEWAYFLCLPRW